MLGTSNPHAPLPLPFFRRAYRLARKDGSAWVQALPDPLPADTLLSSDDRWFNESAEPGDPHPYAGLPLPPGSARCWTVALIEALGMAAYPGHPGVNYRPTETSETGDNTYRLLNADGSVFLVATEGWPRALTSLQALGWKPLSEKDELGREMQVLWDPNHGRPMQVDFTGRGVPVLVATVSADNQVVIRRTDRSRWDLLDYGAPADMPVYMDRLQALVGDLRALRCPIPDLEETRLRLGILPSPT